MQKFENVDLLDCLEKIMNLNVKCYSWEFPHAVKLLNEALRSDNSKNKNLLCFQCSNGTHCCYEKEVFIKNSPSNILFSYEEKRRKHTPIVYAISVKEQIDRKIIGNLYLLDYQTMIDFINRNEITADKKILHYDKKDLVVNFGKRPLENEYTEYGQYIGMEYIPNEPEKLNTTLNEVSKEREYYPVASVKEHFDNQTSLMIKNRISEMTEDEKEDIITHVELSKDFGEADLLTQADIDLYNAIIAERTAKKPSIKKQLAENKGKSEPTKSKTPKKEDISL